MSIYQSQIKSVLKAIVMACSAASVVLCGTMNIASAQNSNKVLDPLEGANNVGYHKGVTETVLMGEMGPTKIDQATFDKLFTGYQGCFVELVPNDSDSHVVYQFIQANMPLSPCGTFDIPNLLIGLETGVSKDVCHVLKTESVAAAVGKQRIQQYLNLIDYGNKDISSGITNFWMDNSLKITAFEQVAFLNRLQQSKLPFSQRTINITKELIFLKETKQGKLFGITGEGKGNDETPRIGEYYNLGWFVGYVVTNEGTFPFATNIRGKDARGEKAREITEEILGKQGLL